MFRPNRSALLLYVLAGFTTASHGSMELIYPLNLDRLGHPLPLIGGMMALIGLGALASRVPGGAWYRLSRARGLSAGALALMGLSTAGLAVGSAWELQAALALAHGFAFGLATTFLLALLIELPPGEESAGPAMAWFTAAISTGYAVGAPLGAHSIERLGHAGAFVVSGLVGLVAALLMLAVSAPRGEAAEAAGSAAPQVPVRGLRALAGLPAGVWLATLLGFYINFVGDTAGTFFPIYAVGLGISLGAVGLFKSAQSLAATGIRFVAAGLFRFLDITVTNHAAVATMALGVAAMSILMDEMLLLVAFVVTGFSRGLIRVTSATMVAEERKRPGGTVGMAAGIYNAGLDVGSMLGPPVAGALAGAFGIPMAFRVVALALPAIYYGVWLMQRSRRGSAAAPRHVEGFRGG